MVILYEPYQARGGGSDAQMAKLTAANQKPLTLWSPNLVTFSFYPSDTFWPNFSKIGQSGGCCCSFLIETSQKILNEKFFLCLKLAQIDTGGQFWVEKNDSGHKNPFFKTLNPFSGGEFDDSFPCSEGNFVTSYLQN